MVGAIEIIIMQDYSKDIAVENGPEVGTGRNLLSYQMYFALLCVCNREISVICQRAHGFMNVRSRLITL